MGYDLDTYFIEKPHHTSPRRLYSQTGADWQYRVDFDRLRSDRLARTRAPGNKWTPRIWAPWFFMPGPISVM
jgi:hypothetical protein